MGLAGAARRPYGERVLVLWDAVVFGSATLPILKRRRESHRLSHPEPQRQLLPAAQIPPRRPPSHRRRRGAAHRARQRNPQQPDPHRDPREAPRHRRPRHRSPPPLRAHALRQLPRPRRLTDFDFSAQPSIDPISQRSLKSGIILTINRGATPGEKSSATPPSPPPCSTGYFTAAPSSTSPATATAAASHRVVGFEVAAGVHH